MAAPKEAKKSGEPGWKYRRWVIYPLVSFACWRLMSLEGAQDTAVNQTLAYGWLGVIICLVLFYTGFATAQDITAIIIRKSGLPYAGPPGPTPPDCGPDGKPGG